MIRSRIFSVLLTHKMSDITCERLSSMIKHSLQWLIEGFRAKRAYTYIAFWADFYFLQDRANLLQTDLF